MAVQLVYIASVYDNLQYLITVSRARINAAFFKRRVYRVHEFSTLVTSQNTRDLVITTRELETNES